jgi:hypothetical protein
VALIFRSILEVEDVDDFVGLAPELFRDWLRRKVRDPDLEFAVDGHARKLAAGCEVACAHVTAGASAAFRGRMFEKRRDEEVKTTLTALQDESHAWAWIDLERWAEDAWRGSWVPYSPGIVGFVLRAGRCSRGPNGLDTDYHLLQGDQGSLLAGQVLDPGREVPIVVTTPTAGELADELGPATERAVELQRRLAGVAPVYLLGSGAVTAFSREMLRAGDQMDVHSGAVRTYLPGAGGERDVPWRHRYVPYRRLSRRPADMAARLVSVPLMRAASHQAPPPIWRDLRELPEFSEGGMRDSELFELVDVAEAELATAHESLKEADARADEAEAGLELERETQAELLAEREDLVRRLNYAQTALRERGESTEPPPGEPQFVPDFCEEVVEYARARFDRVQMGPAVDEGAQQLDEHAEASWARKALRALGALNAYAKAKADGLQGNFWTYCSQTDSLTVVPTSWISMQESETTDQNPRFRSLRMFDVNDLVDESGSVYMPAHIKLEQGGNPAPRIHFYDDTDGPTRGIHVGWLGPHLDNKSKS